jgi:hypothetical protein
MSACIDKDLMAFSPFLLFDLEKLFEPLSIIHEIINPRSAPRNKPAHARGHFPADYLLVLSQLGFASAFSRMVLFNPNQRSGLEVRD